MKPGPVTLAALALLAVMFTLGLGDNALMNLVILVLLYGYWGVCWNLAAGTTGLMSLGHALFVGTGAYTVAYLYGTYGISPWVSAPIAVAIAGLEALIIGFLCFRFKVQGYYFGLLTMACAQIAYLSVTASRALGRSEGLTLDFSDWGLAFLQFREKWPYALTIFIMVCGVMALCRTLLSMRVGYYWRALRDNEAAAEALGVPTFRFKILSIVISAMLTALGGAFYAQYISFVDPRSVLGIDLSVQILVFCIVGGMGSSWGPILGAALLLPLGEAVRTMIGGTLPGASLALYAVVLILVAMLLPQGLASLRGRFSRLRPRSVKLSPAVTKDAL